MSVRSRHRPRRSCYIVSGTRPEMLAAAAEYGADHVILDLEDSVPIDEKKTARSNVVRALRNGDWSETSVAIRVNAWSSPWTYQDVIEVVADGGEFVDTIVLAKTSRASEVTALELLLAQVEHSVGIVVGSIGIEAQIESAGGLADVNAICRTSERLESIVLGPSDMASSLRASRALIRGDDDSLIVPILLSMLIAARSSGVDVIDGPDFQRDDLAGLVEVARRRAELGVDGKWCVDPAQIRVINAAFTPGPVAIDDAQRVLAAFHDADGRLDGRLLDEDARRFALETVRRSAGAR